MVIWKLPPRLLVDITTFSEVSYASFKVETADFFEAPFCVADTMTSHPRIFSCVASQFGVNDSILELIHKCSSDFTVDVCSL